MDGIFNELILIFQNISASSKFLVTVILIFISYIIKKSIRTFTNNLKLESKDIIRFKKLSSNIINITLIIVIILIWISESKDMVTFLGIFSAGVAFAFRDVLSNFLGWLIIVTQKPFHVGDRIRIGDSIGDVLEISWFYTTVIEVVMNDNKSYGQSTGRIVYIPNIKILTYELINESNSSSYFWNEIDLSLSMNSNWEKAKDLILSIADKRIGNMEEEAKDALNAIAKDLPIYYTNLSHTVYTSLEDGKIVLTLRFICRSRNFRDLKHRIVEDILIEFKKHDDINLI